MGDRALLRLMDKSKVNFIARGLHLGDTAISYLWRWMFFDSIPASLNKMKYQPLVQINDGVFLAKPLFLVREIETQLYSSNHNFIPVCCMCPACGFPSRRDIVEESILYIYMNEKSGLWEFSVPGMSDYLKQIVPFDYSYLSGISTKGFAQKCNHIPEPFFVFALDYFRDRMAQVDINQFNSGLFLDDIGKKSFLSGKKELFTGKLPIPKFFLPDIALSEYERRMIATLGPFWGAVGLTSSQQRFALDVQTKIFDFTPDDLWGQVNSLLNIFYKGAS
ncbi:MAG: hypothetical protein LBI14_07120 [Treponema sp.]|nr:hypothetical protein [Treponema sp.]